MDIYSKDKNLEFLIKRWNKLSLAMYAVTKHIKDSDQIKWNIRNRALDIMSFIHELCDIFDGQKSMAIDSMIREIEVLIAEVTISGESGLIGRSNFSLIKEEILKFKNELIEYRNKDAIISPLQKDFMQVEIPRISMTEFKMEKVVIKDTKGHIENKGQDKRHNIDSIRQGRRSIIIDLLKKRSNLSIKDFSVLIKDCSEKTIQRELNSMVEEGVLYRQGDRRWSTYSLVSSIGK